MSKCQFCVGYTEAVTRILEQNKRRKELGFPTVKFTDYGALGYYLDYCPECGRKLKEVIHESGLRD